MSARLGASDEPERANPPADPSDPVQDLDLTLNDTSTRALIEPEQLTNGDADAAAVVAASAMITLENVTKVYEPGVTALKDAMTRLIGETQARLQETHKYLDDVREQQEKAVTEALSGMETQRE